MLVSNAVTEALREGERVLSPGMKYRHYAPNSPVVLIDAEARRMVDFIRDDSQGGRIAVISYTEDIPLIREMLPLAEVLDFGSRSDEMTQAHRLFAILREADKRDYDKIYAPTPNTDGLGLALYNRMIRAAAYNIVKLN